MKRSLFGVAPATAVAAVAVLLLGGPVPGSVAPAEARGSDPIYTYECAVTWPFEKRLGVRACFYSRGDKFRLKDKEADGYSAAVYWKTDYGREGMCVNSRGAGTTKVCNYNMKEEACITFWAVHYDVPERVYEYWSEEASIPIGESFPSCAS
jgi:hypothetical protein